MYVNSTGQTNIKILYTEPVYLCSIACRLILNFSQNCPLHKIGHRAHLPYINKPPKFQRQRRSSYERKNTWRIVDFVATVHVRVI